MGARGRAGTGREEGARRRSAWVAVAMVVVGVTVLVGCGKDQSVNCGTNLAGRVECESSEESEAKQFIEQWWWAIGLVVLGIGAWVSDELRKQRESEGQQREAERRERERLARVEATPSRKQVSAPRQASVAPSSVRSRTEQRSAGEVRIGERVVVNGSARVVVAVHGHVGQPDVVGFTFDDGQTVEVARTHLVAVSPAHEAIASSAMAVDPSSGERHMRYRARDVRAGDRVVSSDGATHQVLRVDETRVEGETFTVLHFSDGSVGHYPRTEYLRGRRPR